VGHPVYAVGNPYRIGITATKGMVSALNRSNLNLTTNGGYESYIQTDTAINPGNSGGLLANRHGRLVGINSATWVADGARTSGLYFAIPSNLVRSVLTQLAVKGAVERGFFGWQIAMPSRKELEAAGLNTMAGAKMEQIMQPGPAAQAGLKNGDIVLEASGKQVTTRGDLRFLASLVEPGGKLPIVYQREGKRFTAELTAGRNEPKDTPADGLFQVEALRGVDFRKGRAGITVERIGKAESSKTGLVVGMEITEINGKPITNATEAGAALTNGVNRIKARSGPEELTLAARLPLDAAEKKE
jgi:S1-C subfamily serine protease